jgi:hypothetical protein
MIQAEAKRAVLMALPTMTIVRPGGRALDIIGDPLPGERRHDRGGSSACQSEDALALRHA